MSIEPCQSNKWDEYRVTTKILNARIWRGTLWIIVMLKHVISLWASLSCWNCLAVQNACQPLKRYFGPCITEHIAAGLLVRLSPISKSQVDHNFLHFRHFSTTDVRKKSLVFTCNKIAQTTLTDSVSNLIMKTRQKLIMGS